nr:PREDICTED: N-acetylserotonin O-methyltransferase-like protein [Bemisia tabaci]
MLEPILHLLNKQRIVLASGSPRRKEILSQVGLKFEVVTSKFPETLDLSNYKTHADYAIDTAFHKVKEVSDREAADLIIGADTVVSLGDKILEKPESDAHAVAMLTELSGKQHTVYTGVIIKKGDKYVKFSEETKVKIGDLPKSVIEAYVKTGEPLDKAGGYGVQGIGGSLIQGIEGDFYNVMGLPLYHFCQELSKLYDT